MRLSLQFNDSWKKSKVLMESFKEKAQRKQMTSWYRANRYADMCRLADTAKEMEEQEQKLGLFYQPEGEQRSITAEQFALTLVNMTRAWETMPESKRLRKSEERSYGEDFKQISAEIVERWHSGQSSHPDVESLKEIYPNNEEGTQTLFGDLTAIGGHPCVQEAYSKLNIAKYTVADA